MRNNELERRFERFQETTLQNQARFDENMAKMAEAIAGLIRVARTHDEHIDQNTQHIKEIRESLKEQREHIDALIRIVEGHISHHP